MIEIHVPEILLSYCPMFHFSEMYHISSCEFSIINSMLQW